MNSASNQMETDMTLRRPLQAGEPVVYWRLSATDEARYDAPDQPMQGEMDPFFFLTKHKNFIPHEYPCRTLFAAERRGKRPEVGATTPKLARVWLPFGSPRVDLSGFWFRATELATFAETTIRAQSAGAARFALRTCGGAVLFVNGREAGFMAPYGRNLETIEEFTVQLEAGDNVIGIFFDDLAERDARYYFQLDYVSGPLVEHALPIAVEAPVADAMEAMLASMHFEKPAYGEGEVALVADTGLPVDVTAKVVIEGDFMSIEKPLSFERELAAGSLRLAVADTADLPADFRHFKVTLSCGDYAVSRVFGVELCHVARQGLAPASLTERIEEALGEVANHAEADTVRALARFAIGMTGAATDAMIASALPAIEDCHDCADFILVPLIWCRAAYGDEIGAEVRDRVDAAILNYRYWMDEPGNDVQWYFSENHALLFHTAAYLAGHMLPEARFVRSGRTGVEQSAVGAARVRAWLDHFEKWEMAEFNSAPYFPIDLKGLCALYALAPDGDIADRAGKAIIRLVEIVARSAHHGVMTGAQGRSYEHTLRASRSLELSGIARMIWGRGNYGMRFHALPQLALCLRDHGLHIPGELAAVASVSGNEGHEWTFAQGQDRFARLYHYKTASYALGSAVAYRWNQWGYQETVLHLRLGDNPDATIWINHPGEVLHSGYGRPSYWGGSGTLPRVHQYRGLAVVRFDCADEQPDFTHAWFPQAAFDEARIEGNTALALSGGGCVMLKVDTGLQLVTTGPTAGNELRAPGRKATWIVRLGDHDSASALEDAVGALRWVDQANGDILVDDPEYGMVRFGADGSVEAEGRRLDPAEWTIEGAARTF
ncbi:hypothetical protein [Martelella soudanensis]|uniref:hypothetical protein n=1 Tax=unclassified Martelella TaxID=2629616 RepID=UPI00352FF052